MALKTIALNITESPSEPGFADAVLALLEAPGNTIEVEDGVLLSRDYASGQYDLLISPWDTRGAGGYTLSGRLRHWGAGFQIRFAEGRDTRDPAIWHINLYDPGVGEDWTRENVDSAAEAATRILELIGTYTQSGVRKAQP